MTRSETVQGVNSTGEEAHGANSRTNSGIEAGLEADRRASGTGETGLRDGCSTSNAGPTGGDGTTQVAWLLAARGMTSG